MNTEQGYAILEHPQGAFPNFLVNERGFGVFSRHSFTYSAASV
jgi:hypothetical protein